jgi:bacteriocin biosynthesis cyclodehydratase domain-containing protein
VLRYVLDPALPVLKRPDGAVQVGWDPRRAVLVRPPAGLSPGALADVLRAMHTPVPLSEVEALARHRGAQEPATTAALVGELITAGIVRTERTQLRSASVRIHGRGPLSELMAGALRCSGTRVRNSNLNHAGVTRTGTDLVLLTDFLATDPQVVHDLHAAEVAHLPVRVRDGRGLIGPLVVPGRTSCLRCADLHRSERDAAWPAIAAQLRRAIGHADRTTLLATAALALTEVDRVVAAVHAGGDPTPARDPAPTTDTTWEIDVRTGATTTRRWTRHPRCGC